MPEIKIVIVDDSPSDIFVMIRTFEKNTNIKVIQSFKNGVDFLNAYEKLPVFDCLIMDMRLPIMNGKEVIMELKSKNVSFKIYAVTYGLFPSMVKELSNSGAHAFSRKNPDLLSLLIPKVVEGDTIYEDQAKDSWVVNGIKLSMFELEKKIWLSIITPYERAILNGFADELTLSEISMKEDVDIFTLEKYRKQILKKLTLKTDVQLINFAKEHHFGYRKILK